MAGLAGGSWIAWAASGSVSDGRQDGQGQQVRVDPIDNERDEIEVSCNGRFLLSVAGFYAVCLSVFSAHQEYRFLLPCLPVLHVVLGSAMHNLTARLGYFCFCSVHSPPAISAVC